MGRKINLQAASRRQRKAVEGAPKCAASRGPNQARNARRHPPRRPAEPMRPAITATRVATTTSRHRPHRRHPLTEALCLSSLIYLLEDTQMEANLLLADVRIPKTQP